MKIRLTRLLVLILIALHGTAFAAADVDPAEAGRMALDRHDCDGAIRLLTKALAAPGVDTLEAVADRARNYFNRALAYECKGQLARAIDDYGAGMRLRPSDPMFRLNRGMAYLKQHQNDLAIADLNAGVDLAPDMAEAYITRAGAFITLGENERALVDAKKALALDPNLASAHAQLGSLLGKQGQFEQAIAEHSAAVRLAPNYWPYRVQLGLAEFAGGLFEEAATDFERSLRLKSDNAYLVILHYLARARAGHADIGELARNTAKLDLDRWPGPVIELLRARKTPEQVRAAANQGSDEARLGQNCEAAFYIGEDRLVHDDAGGAAPLLEEAAAICPGAFGEGLLAAAELGRIRSAVNGQNSEPATKSVSRMNDAEFDAQFQCPETYQSYDLAKQKLQEYFDWIGARHGDWTVDTVMSYRYALLVRHQCTQTLRNIKQNKDK